ncbi:hypothetical protein IHN32_15265 [Deinococcus sp. 14RED07]|uniref:DoxX family protein n=1 Tax=Deinococcus sp. 14RED07 TaxID=2745874 RepID=UPI001E48D936|nr:DoxX family protein [Deinococcus sp. 14RED07]MCD0177304.1 hypothetical protein [Deinococcus sp. 14RED07]
MPSFLPPNRPPDGLGVRWLACWLLLTLLGWYSVTLTPLARQLAGETGPPLTGEPPSAFILFGLNAGLALIVALAWGRAEGDRGWTARAAPWIMRAARLSLAYVLFIYGWQKVFLLQMAQPDHSDLLTRFGQMNHMGLLWRTVGASPLFQFVGGALEVLPAFLLLHRRTALAGALLAVPVRSFVLLLNLSFNVFVKLGAANLLLLAVAILWPHLPNLWRAVRNEPTRPLPAPPGLPGPRPLRTLARVVVLGYVTCAPLLTTLDFVQKWSPRPVPPRSRGRVPRHRRLPTRPGYRERLPLAHPGPECLSRQPRAAVPHRVDELPGRSRHRCRTLRRQRTDPHPDSGRRLPAASALGAAGRTTHPDRPGERRSLHRHPGTCARPRHPPAERPLATVRHARRERVTAATKKAGTPRGGSGLYGEA